MTLNPGNWVLLVVNSGSGGPAGDGNLVYHNPVAGTAYFGPLNNGGQQGAVSHWIVCTGAPTPQPEPQVTPGAWVDGNWECGDTTVDQTRTVTTTPYVLVNGLWTLDVDHATVTTEHETRDLTADELATCIPDQPQAQVTYGNWVDGNWECGDTTVDQTRTVTTTPYALVNGEWQLDTANATSITDNETRDLTADELATCIPDQPQAQVTYGNWVDGNWECGDTTVDQTRTVTTTPYALVNGEWQLDTANATSITDNETRDLTADELATCIPDQPQAQVTYGDWVDGNWECGDTTVDQTRTVTTTPYVLVEGEWQLDAANATVTAEHQTRELAADERFACDIVVPTQSPAFVEATCTADAALVLPETTGVTYTSNMPATAGATVTVVATPHQGYTLSGQTQWTHTFTTLDASQCTQSEALTPTEPQTGSQQIIDTPTQTDQAASEAPAPTPVPTAQLPKTGNDHVTLLALIAAVLLGGGVALSAGAARRRT